MNHECMHELGPCKYLYVCIYKYVWVDTYIHMCVYVCWCICVGVCGLIHFNILRLYVYVGVDIDFYELFIDVSYTYY